MIIERDDKMKILLKYKNIVAGLILIIATILNMMYFNKLSHKFWCGIYLLSVADIMWFITSACLLFNFKKITPTLLIITGIAHLIKPDGCIGWTRISSILGCVSIALLGIYQIIRPKSKKHSILNYFNITSIRQNFY